MIDLAFIMQHVFGRFMRDDEPLSAQFRAEYYAEQVCNVAICGKVLHRVFV